MAAIVVDIDSTNCDELHAKGRKALLLRQYKAATVAFSRLAQLKAEELGDSHDSLGEIYLSYGRALLELAREESDALGETAIKSGSEDNDGDDDDDDDGEEEKGEDEKKSMEVEEKDAGDKVKEGEKEEKKNGHAVDSEGDAKVEKMDDGETKAEAKEMSKTNETVEEKKELNETKPEEKMETDEKQTGGEKGDAEKENGVAIPGGSQSTNAPEEEEDCTDLQLAWEVLELAKGIFELRGDSAKDKLAETLITLGEISTENEMFDNAIADMSKGLELQKSVFGDSARIIAETLYKLGIVNSTFSKFDDAVQNFRDAITCLENCIKKLEEATENKDEEEIEELKSLIPEIEEKIADTETGKNEAVQAIKESLDLPKTEVLKPSETAAKGATNISHLVKRKRKPEEETETATVESPAKKQAQE